MKRPEFHWSTEPVIAWAKAHRVSGENGEPPTCDHIGFPGPAGRQRWERCKTRGWLRDREAEHVAAHIGVEPVKLWPGWYALALDVRMDAGWQELAEWDEWRLRVWSERVARYSAVYCGEPRLEMAA